MDNINMSGGGMIQPGKWVNRLNGDVILVRDSLIDGDKMIVLTNKGQLDMQEFSDYIQLEDGEDVPTLADLYGNNKNKNQLLAQINQGLDPEDRIKPQENNNSNNSNSTLTKGLGENKIEEKKNVNYKLIKKVFDKFPIERTINFEIVEDEWPFKEFNMLVNVLDVPMKDICDYVIDNFFDKEHLSKSLSEYFNEHI